MDPKESLTKLLSLLSRTVIEEENTDQHREKKRTDIEEAAALLHLSNGNFSNIALALDELSSLNLAATEFNDSVADMAQSRNDTFHTMRTDIDALSSTHSHSHLPLDTFPSPDDAQSAKLEFATQGLENHLAARKIFPYDHNTNKPDGTLVDPFLDHVDQILSGVDADTVLTLQAMNDISKRIVDLRNQNDIKENQLNLEYNYHQSCHLISQSDGDDHDHNTLTQQNIINEIKQLETECFQMDEELSRILEENCHREGNY